MAYLALLVYTAIMFVRPQEWVPGMLGWPIEYYVVIFALVTWFASMVTGDWKPGEVPQNWLMLGLFFAVLMSHVVHFRPYWQGLVDSFNEFGKVVLVYFLMVSLLKETRHLKLFLFVVIAGCLFLTIHIILQMLTGTGLTGQPPLVQNDEGGGIERAVATGIFGDPNDLALTLVAMAPFPLSVFFRRNAPGALRLLAGAVAAAMVWAIYLTNSRGGWLALGVMGLTFLFMHFSKKAGIALAVIAVAALVGFGPSRVGMTSSDDDSFRARRMAWADGNQMLKSAPIFGVGKGLYTDKSENGLVAHNSFVHCYAELGLFGYFFWMAMVCASLKDAYALSKLTSEKPEGSDYAMLGRASLAALMGILAASFFLSKTYFVLLFILFGIVAAARRLTTPEGKSLEGSFQKQDAKYVVLVEFLSIPAIYVFMRVTSLRG